jgi:hypothetical protein
MRREKNQVTRRVMNMNVEGWRGRGRPKKRWIDCVRQDMREMAVSDRREWSEDMLRRPQMNWAKRQKEEEKWQDKYSCLR